MNKFTVEETNLICVHSTDTRENLIAELSEMQTYLELDEPGILALTHSVIGKLENMSDMEFDSNRAEFVADFEE